MDRRQSRTALEVFRDAGAGVAFLALAFGVVKMTLLIDVLEPKLLVTVENVDRVTIITGRAMSNLEQATRALKKQEDLQAQSIVLLTGKISVIADSANRTVGRVNDTLGSLGVMIDAANGSVTRVSNAAAATLADLQPALRSLNTELEQLPAVTRDLDKSMVELTPVLTNMQAITGNTAAVTGDLQLVADHYTKQILAPVSKAKAAAKVIAHYAVEFRGVRSRNTLLTRPLWLEELMSNIFKTIIKDVEGLWDKEEPVIEAALLDAAKAIEPVWKTALGKIVLATVTDLQGYASSAGGPAAAKVAVVQVGVAVEAAGKTASTSTVNTLIELAVQKLQAVAPTA